MQYTKCYNNISMKKNIKIFYFFCIFCLSCSLFIPLTKCLAQPYGKGLYGIIKYGDQTSLSINTDGDLNIPITPDTNGVLATGSSSITITSTDVKGYKLYIRPLSSTDMNNLGATIPTSSNITQGPLGTNNTWGYNIDGSNNFIGMNPLDTMIKSVSTPKTSGDVTTVTYGIKLDLSKPAGNYKIEIVYTAVPQTD